MWPEVQRLTAAGYALRAQAEAAWPHDPAHDAEVTSLVAAGWVIVAATPYGTSLVNPYAPPTISTAGHVAATILTFGLWLPFWLIAEMVDGSKYGRSQSRRLVRRGQLKGRRRR